MRIIQKVRAALSKKRLPKDPVLRAAREACEKADRLIAEQDRETTNAACAARN